MPPALPQLQSDAAQAVDTGNQFMDPCIFDNFRVLSG